MMDTKILVIEDENTLSESIKTYFENNFKFHSKIKANMNCWTKETVSCFKTSLSAQGINIIVKKRK